MLGFAAVLAGCAGVPRGSPPTPVAPAPGDGSGDLAPLDTMPPALALPALPPPPATEVRRVDVADEETRRSLWDRIRDAYELAPIDDELVGKWEQWYAGRPDYVERMTTRSARYLFYIVEEIERRGLPIDLALLPFVESAFNPQALSAARAAGIWQFTPGTGRNFELLQSVFGDERHGVLASTRAALDYLERLYAQFGDWRLALAAYNWGPGNVQRALARAEAAGTPADYEHLRLPDETRNYLPKLQAVKNIVARPADYGLALAPLENHPYFLGVEIDRDIDVALAVELAGLTPEQFGQLNPQIATPVVLAAFTPQLLLPYDNANRFLRELARHPGPFATWTAWVAPRTLSPAAAAKLVGMPERELVAVNRIPAKMLVKAGSTLLVPRQSDGADVAVELAGTATIAFTPVTPPLQRVAFKAGRKGDSVAAVARRYRVGTQQVARWNGVSKTARFKAGQTIVVMLPAKRAKPVRVARSTRASGGRTRRPAEAEIAAGE